MQADYHTATREISYGVICRVGAAGVPLGLPVSCLLRFFCPSRCVSQRVMRSPLHQLPLLLSVPFFPLQDQLLKGDITLNMPQQQVWVPCQRLPPVPGSHAVHDTRQHRMPGSAHVQAAHARRCNLSF